MAAALGERYPEVRWELEVIIDPLGQPPVHLTELGGVQTFNPSATTGGVGGGTFGQATAVGNQLNVVTTGSNNIVIVDSNQINNGDQTANNNVH